jgi:hypothetical protein
MIPGCFTHIHVAFCLYESQGSVEVQYRLPFGRQAIPLSKLVAKHPIGEVEEVIKQT